MKYTVGSFYYKEPLTVCVAVGPVCGLYASCGVHQAATPLYRWRWHYVTMPHLPLSTNVVSGVHGQMVCQSAGPDAARNLAELSMSVSHVSLNVLYAGCMPGCVITHRHLFRCFESLDNHPRAWNLFSTTNIENNMNCVISILWLWECNGNLIIHRSCTVSILNKFIITTAVVPIWTST